ncbi:hypothetical protein D5086_032101, partial [Populus alba]
MSIQNIVLFDVGVYLDWWQMFYGVGRSRWEIETVVPLSLRLISHFKIHIFRWTSSYSEWHWHLVYYYPKHRCDDRDLVTDISDMRKHVELLKPVIDTLSGKEKDSTYNV